MVKIHFYASVVEIQTQKLSMIVHCEYLMIFRDDLSNDRLVAVESDYCDLSSIKMLIFVIA